LHRTLLLKDLLSSSGIAPIIEQQRNVTLSHQTVSEIHYQGRYKRTRVKGCSLHTIEQTCARIQFSIDFAGPMFQELLTLAWVLAGESRFCSHRDSHRIWRKSGKCLVSNLSLTTNLTHPTNMV
jgi:hypothetical protein